MDFPHDSIFQAGIQQKWGFYGPWMVTPMAKDRPKKPCWGVSFREIRKVAAEIVVLKTENITRWFTLKEPWYPVSSLSFRTFFWRVSSRDTWWHHGSSPSSEVPRFPHHALPVPTLLGAKRKPEHPKLQRDRERFRPFLSLRKLNSQSETLAIHKRIPKDLRLDQDVRIRLGPLSSNIVRLQADYRCVLRKMPNSGWQHNWRFY